MSQENSHFNLFAFVYQKFLKRIFFEFDPELIHDHITFMGQLLGSNIITRKITSLMFNFQDKSLQQNILGINFKNPIGLAAGFDKNARLTSILPAVGFGFEEVGSITGESCMGNKKPRLWRLKKSQSLMVYYGLMNDGCEKIAERLKGKKFQFPVGISVAKTNSKDTVDEQKGIDDYFKAYKTFVENGIGDYYTINISCPNAFGGEPFSDPEKLDRLLSKITTIKNQKPIFLKMPAEISELILDKIIEVARKYKISGFISTNLAKNRNNQNIKDKHVPVNGGMSGKVVQELSDRQIAYIYKKTKGEFVIIGCGGIFSAEDAYRKIQLGANLIQLITGMIFEGPQLIGQINQGLAELLKKDGYKNITEAVGSKNK